MKDSGCGCGWAVTVISLHMCVLDTCEFLQAMLSLGQKLSKSLNTETKK